jgi:Ca-activated chloride channel homolog
MIAVRLAAVLVALTSIAWLDPDRAIRDANRLYAEGKYEEAAAAYNAALIDRPDSAPLHFNLGDATYKQGKYEEAVTAFRKVETSDAPERASRVAYNVGNALFRQGQAVEQSEPQKALEVWAEALVSYRRALGLTPDDEDVKFNHEMVAKRIAELKKKLEEQKQQQQQDQQQQEQQQQEQKQDQAQDQQQPQQDQQQPQDQQPPGEQQEQPQEEEKQQQAGDEQEQQQEQAGAEEPEQQPQPEQQQEQQQEQAGTGGEEPRPEPGQQQADGEAVAGEKQDDALSKGEAAAILDSQRGEEVRPEDIIRKLQGARVAEPAQDW